MNADMFDNWPTTFEPPTRRIVDPPMPVLVNVGQALYQTANTSTFRDDTPLKVRAEGLASDLKVQGTLVAWARFARGSWIACVNFSVPTGNGHGRLDLTGQWCPSDAITPLR